MDEIIKFYSQKKQLSLLDIGRFKTEVMKRERIEPHKINVVFCFFPNKYFNAAVLKFPFINRYFILINLFQLVEKRKDPVACLFIIYRSIIHELTHISLLNLDECQTITNYRSLLACWEQWLDKNDSIFVRISRQIRMLRKQNDILSMAEQKCIKSGIITAFDTFKSFMGHDFKKRQSGIMAATSFLYDNLEIIFYNGKTIINNFAYLIYRTQKVYKKTGKVCPFASELFYKNGVLKSIDEFYLNRTESNSDVYDEIILRSFLNLEFDFSAMFKRVPELKEHVQYLANKQLEKNVQYMENCSLAGIFLDDNWLAENTKMILLDSDRLNYLMRKYGLKHTGRTLYSM